LTDARAGEAMFLAQFVEQILKKHQVGLAQL
jgi:hypothetical protein